MQERGRPLTSALGVSATIHAVLFVLLVMWAGLRPETVVSKAPPMRTDLVYLQQAGPRGGGGGNSAPARPARVEIPAHRQPSVPVESVAKPPDPPLLTIDVLAVTNHAALLQGGGTTLAAPPGPGGGRGTGLAGGDGPGLNPGSGGNTGGGPRRLGAGVTPPVPIREVKPAYTAEALTRKISGSVTLEVVVLADGSVGDVKVAVSLDRAAGLDNEAIKAARQWRFQPALFEGKPVDVIVRIILDFNLR